MKNGEKDFFERNNMLLVENALFLNLLVRSFLKARCDNARLPLYLLIMQERE